MFQASVLYTFQKDFLYDQTKFKSPKTDFPADLWSKRKSIKIMKKNSAPSILCLGDQTIASNHPRICGKSWCYQTIWFNHFPKHWVFFGMISDNLAAVFSHKTLYLLRKIFKNSKSDNA